MRARKMPVMILVMTAALGGCGQKGPLYRENPEASAKPVEQANSAATRNERPGDHSAQADALAE
ncbi:lipoprotein [Marinobacter sp. 1-3A]|uniref:Lipoprotein n=1 Tax=Marinobacter xiaoshiensis TaxID=3073652 RepID=A0ABU2HBX3_9GAMM|nr:MULTISPECIES: lipoprotein [unclassified Marinobacter]MBK1874006.1 lipoprotein [Marinobacter sp. 1-3A]MDS1308586.1 lipoprotein [Marinobacter sp. F60267]